MKRFFTVDEVATLCGLAVEKLRDDIDNKVGLGKFAIVLNSKTTRFDLEDLDDWFIGSSRSSESPKE